MVFSYTLYHIPKSGGYSTQTQIATEHIHGIPVTTDTGGLEINTAKVELRSPRGEFITTVTGVTKLEHYDHFRIVLTDEDGNTYDREFEWAPGEQSLEITEGSNIGRVITLNLKGIEYHTQKVHYVKPNYRESGYDVARDISEQYNRNRGVGPEIQDADDNGLPTYLFNNYPYGDFPAVAHDRLQELTDSFGAPPEVGGTQDFYTLGFDTKGSTFNKVDLKVRSLGSTPATPVVLENAVLGLADDDKATSLSPPEFTRIIGIFNQRAGSLPPDFARYTGTEQRFNFLPVWDSTIQYPIGAEVKQTENGRIAYRARIASIAGTPISNTAVWTAVPFASYVGSIQYSPWTDDKFLQWRNNGFDPTAVTPWGESMPDFNLHIKSDEFFRVPVDYVANVPSDIPAELLYGGTQLYRGFRLLVLAGTGVFSGISNTVMQYNGTIWVTKYTFGSNNVGAIIIDECTGNGYEFNGTGFVETINPSARDESHNYADLQNVQGFIQNTGGMSTNQDSAVEITYDVPLGAQWLLFTSAQEAWAGLLDFNDIVNFNTVSLRTIPVGVLLGYLEDNETLRVTTFAINRAFYNAGVSLRFKFPFPATTFGEIDEQVGQIYGGTTLTGQEPATFDIQNNHLTHDGKRGYNQDTSEDLGKGYGLGFFIRMSVSLVHLNTPLLAGEANFPVRVYITDTSDNVMYQDITVPFNGKWERYEMPFSGFRPYHGLRPKHLIDRFIPPVQREQFDEFEWQNIKTIGWTLLTAYDDEGRFDTIGSQLETLDVVGGAVDSVVSLSPEPILSNLQGKRIKMAIDGLHIIKELVVISDPTTDINHETIIRIPEISNYAQGEYYIKNHEEKLRFPKQNLILDIRSRYDIRYGDSITYKNEDTVDETDGEVKLAVTRIEHQNVSTPGSRTLLYCTRRFE